MKDRSSHKSHKKLFGVLAVVFVVLVALFYITITKSGRWLVQDDEFTHVKWAVILDGQTPDLERNDFAAGLLAEGKVDSVMILGRRAFRDKSNADFYAEDFLTLGNFDKGTIFLARHDDPSTVAEAYTIIPWIKLHRMDTVLLVTAAAATHRAVNIFTHLTGTSTTYLAADIHHYMYNADDWFFDRESRKSWLHEWAALLNSYFDLWGRDTLDVADSTYYSRIRSIAEEELDDPVIDLQQLSKKAAAGDTVKAADSTKVDSVKEDSVKADSAKTDIKPTKDTATVKN